MLRGHPKDTLDQLHVSRGRWIPRFIHRNDRGKQGIWGRWNEEEDGKVYGFDDVKAFWYTGEKSATEEGPKPRQPGDPVMLHFHGGGYLCGTAAETDATSNIPKALVKHSPIHHILSVDYRLAPTAPWPLPLLDAISAYYWLVKVEGVEESDIIVAGDSAGGHLALTLTRWLRDEGGDVGVGLPRGMVLMSPWADLGFTNAWGDEAIKHNKDCDTIDDTFGPFACALLLRALPAEIMHTSPYISPASLLIPSSVNGQYSFENFPATYIVYGGAERLSTNIQLLWNRIRRSRELVKPIISDRAFVSPDGVHDFMIFPWMAEEASEVYEDLDVWLRQLLSADLPEEDEQSVAESLELEEDESSWREMIRQRRLTRQMTRESIKSHKSPVMGPVRDDLGMMRMMEDMSEEGLSMITTDLFIPKSPEWLTPLTSDLRPDYGMDDDEIPWYDLDAG
uniref:Endoplasmic reticulum protein n=1 Tax=Kwoniella bestiolae CBS 10118 TaxID=1296100 RepID=A0A1B9FVW5_9TREE|nr:endoplasmic reticulum protein [Kwoniella bestiolae CBS 10118]OCF22922.1 endoplasmic reticulum protein [Kwoniella bestiolae CBS 10118]